MDIRILLGQFILGEVTLVKLKQSASSYLNLSFTEKDEIKEVLHAIRCATRQTLAPAGGTYEVPTFIAINLDGSTEPSRIRLSLPVNKDDHTCSWSDITRAILGTLNQTFFKDYPHSLVLVTPHGNMPIQNIDGALACTVNQDPFFTKITSNRCFVIDHVERRRHPHAFTPFTACGRATSTIRVYRDNGEEADVDEEGDNDDDNVYDYGAE